MRGDLEAGNENMDPNNPPADFGAARHQDTEPRHSASRTNTRFMAAVVQTITGVASVESLAKTLVAGAVHDALDGVAKAHELDIAALMATYGRPAIEAWTRTHEDGPMPLAATLCTALTRSNRPCTKPAKVGTLCAWHFGQGIDRDAPAPAPRPSKAHAPRDAHAAQTQAQTQAKRQRIQDFQASLATMPPPPPRRHQGGFGFSQQPGSQGRGHGRGQVLTQATERASEDGQPLSQVDEAESKEGCTEERRAGGPHVMMTQVSQISPSAT